MSRICKTPEDVLRTIQDHKIAMIDLRFADLPGSWQHFSVPPSALELDSFSDGVGFDGSSIRGFQEIQESDMLVVPDPATAFLDPFTEAPTMVLICNILDPVSRQTYSRDSRYVAQKAEAYLKRTGIGDTAYFGPELEFFIFNAAVYDQGTNYGYYEIDAIEANWNGDNKNNRPNSVTSCARRKAISRCRPPTPCRMSAAAWSCTLSKSASPWKRTTTRLQPAGRQRSTCDSRRSRAWPTT